MTPDQWAAFIQQHGGIVSQAATTPTMTNPATGETQANPDSPIKYVLGDNTWVTAAPQPPMGPPGPYNILQTGTAIKPAPSAAAKAPKTQVSGGVTYQYDPSTNKWLTADGIPADPTTSAKLAVAQQNADSTASRAASAQQNADTAAGRASSSAAIGQENADTRATSAASLDASRQQSADLAQARLAWNQGIQSIDAAVAQGKLTLADAQAALLEKHQEVAEWLSARQADLNYADAQGKTAEAMYAEQLQHTVPAGANASMTALLNNQATSQGQPGLLKPGGGPAPDPLSFIQNATTRALLQLQSGNLGSLIGQNPRSAGQPQPGPTSAPFLPPPIETPVQSGFQLPRPATPTGQMAPGFSAPTPTPSAPQLGSGFHIGATPVSPTNAGIGFGLS